MANILAIYKMILGFVAGIFQNVFTSVGSNYLTKPRRHKQYRSLVGTWVEANDAHEDRPFSICEFTLDPSNGELAFGGYSYRNDGAKFHRWSSVFVHIENKEEKFKKLLYIYSAERLDDHVATSGFGCIHIRCDETKEVWVAGEGYFMDIDEKKFRSSRMRRFEDVAKFLERDPKAKSDKDFERTVIVLDSGKNTMKSRGFFGWSKKES